MKKWAFYCAAGIAMGGCKETTPRVNDRKPGSIDGKELAADSQAEIKASADFYFLLWDKSFSTKITDLPLDASVAAEHIPYSDTWYPQKYGGTNARNGASQSPLEKYDAVFHNGQSTAAKWEQENHTVDASAAEAGWAGHCNGFAASAQRHSQPKNPVTRGTTTFQPQDIKALLAEVHMSAKYLFLGGQRCENKASPVAPRDRPDVTKVTACDDVNPGTFHVALANWIGKLKHSIIFDENSGYQVWNYPVYKYATRLTAVSRDTAMQQISGGSGNYIFNARAEKFMSVQTTITFANAAFPTQGGPQTIPQDRAYTYILELNASDEVIGGEWTGSSQSDHPDFLWVAFEPVVSNGNASFGNPQVDPTEVIKLWAESIGADPNHPPLDILQPTSDNNWGKYNSWTLSMDGSSSGTAYLGKSILWSITRRGSLLGDVSVEVSLNGEGRGTFTASGNADVTFSLDPPPGYNQLGVTFKRSGAIIESQQVYFHAIP